MIEALKILIPVMVTFFVAYSALVYYVMGKKDKEIESIWTHLDKKADKSDVKDDLQDLQKQTTKSISEINRARKDSITAIQKSIGELVILIEQKASVKSVDTMDEHLKIVHQQITLTTKSVEKSERMFLWILSTSEKPEAKDLVKDILKA